MRHVAVSLQTAFESRIVCRSEPAPPSELEVTVKSRKMLSVTFDVFGEVLPTHVSDAVDVYAPPVDGAVTSKAMTPCVFGSTGSAVQDTTPFVSLHDAVGTGVFTPMRCAPGGNGIVSVGSSARPSPLLKNVQM